MQRSSRATQRCPQRCQVLQCDDPAHWPQRAVYQAALAPGLMIELIAVTAAEVPAGQA
jgi:hypothetical protein